MNDKEIIEAILSEDNCENIIMTDDNNDTFEMAQLAVIPLHDMVYGVLELLKINSEAVSEADSGLVILELDVDDETDEYYVSTVDDETLFAEIIAEYESIPEKE